MPPALDDIRFLSDSEYRGDALHELEEDPRTQAELRAALGASSATVSRLLRSFRARHWVEQTGGTYELTPQGRFVTEEFGQLYARMQAVDRLNQLAEWLPAELLSLGFRYLADADVTFPSPNAPLAPMERATDIKYAATHSRSLSYMLPTACLSAHCDSVNAGRQTLDAVYTPDLFEAIAKSDAVSQFVDLLQSDRTTFSMFDGDLPCIIGLNDDSIYIFVVNDRGVPLALIETGDETVFEWGEALFEEYRRAAEPITVEAFAAF